MASGRIELSSRELQLVNPHIVYVSLSLLHFLHFNVSTVLCLIKEFERALIPELMIGAT